MKPIKLSEVKTGDVIYDLDSNNSGQQTGFRCVRTTQMSVYFKHISGPCEYIDEDGMIRFSSCSNELFYKQN
jgi:hypothetical protein